MFTSCIHRGYWTTPKCIRRSRFHPLLCFEDVQGPEAGFWASSRASLLSAGFRTTARASPLSAVDRARRILKMDPGCTCAELKEAYRVAAVECHPDRHPPEKREEATKVFQRLGEAYACLKYHIESGGESVAGGSSRTSTSTSAVDAEKLFREIFGSMADAQVLQALLNSSIGETQGMAMLSLRRITCRIGEASGTSKTSCKVDERWPWRPR